MHIKYLILGKTSNPEYEKQIYSNYLLQWTWGQKKCE